MKHANQQMFLLLFMVFYVLTSHSKPPPQYQESWHVTIPLCARNVRAKTSVFAPYQYSLWDLAPKKGKGIRIVMLDTPIAGYHFEDNHDYSKHPDINGMYEPAWGCLSVIKHHHTTHQVRYQSHRICPDCLPALKTSDVLQHKKLLHGTHAYGLITSQRFGLAPQAEVIVINMFTQEGTCNTALLIQALEKAITLKPDMLLIEANLDHNIPEDSAPARRINFLCSKIPWVIVPAGNRGNYETTLSQPAGMPHITISVGAYGYQNNQIFVPSFSQREPGKGPDLLAPGWNITSAGVPLRDNHAPTIVLSGTSSAAALATAFIALLLGEFKTKLTKEQLLEILHQATWQLDAECADKSSTYGILDMRLALYCAHSIEHNQNLKCNDIKKILMKKITSQSDITCLNKLLKIKQYKGTANPHIKIMAFARTRPKDQTDQREVVRREGALAK